MLDGARWLLVPLALIAPSGALHAATAPQAPGVTSPRPAVSEALVPYVEFLAERGEDPVEYLLGLLEERDLVILCERWHSESTQ